MYTRNHVLPSIDTYKGKVLYIDEPREGRRDTFYSKRMSIEGPVEK